MYYLSTPSNKETQLHENPYKAFGPSNLHPMFQQSCCNIRGNFGDRKSISGGIIWWRLSHRPLQLITGRTKSMCICAFRVSWNVAYIPTTEATTQQYSRKVFHQVQHWLGNIQPSEQLGLKLIHCEKTGALPPRSPLSGENWNENWRHPRYTARSIRTVRLRT